MDPAFIELHDRFLNVLDDPDCTWLDVWSLLVESPAVQTLLDQCAQQAAAKRGFDSHATADLRQEVVIRLGRRIQQRPDLGVDRSRSQRTFQAWLRTIVGRLCAQVAHQMYRARHVSLADEAAIATDHQRAHGSVELSDLLDRLPDEQRDLVLLLIAGHSPYAIARQLGVSRWHVDRRLAQALHTLRPLLEPRR